MFGYKAFVHIPKYERSKLEVKTQQCVFIGCGLDQFGYRFYNPIQKRHIRSHDAVFVEDETIEDIEKTQSITFRSNNSLADLELIPPTMVPRDTKNETQNDQLEIGDPDASIGLPLDDSDDNGVHDQSPPLMGSSKLRRFTRVCLYEIPYKLVCVID